MREENGVMKRIEELLNFSENKQRYSHLKSNLIEHRLAVFFGAGLSLGGKDARNWESPFSIIYNNILMPKLEYFEDYIEKRQQSLQKSVTKCDDYIKGIEQGKNQASEIRVMLLQGQKLYSTGSFLEAGDILSEALDYIKEIYSKWGIGEKLGDIQDKNFDNLIVDVFKRDSYPEVEKIYDSPYKICALFFVPYIGNALITTNIEPSFDEVAKRLKIPSWHRILAKASSSMEMDWIQETKRIFYIHGHILEPDSLVMTGREYDKMYPKLIPADDRVYGARELLKKTVQEKSVLFLGASLNQDRTVDIINYETHNSVELRQEANLHFFPVIGANVLGMINTPPNLVHSEPILYSKGEFQEISLLLLQLIRDTDDKWDNCKWVKPSFKCGPKGISNILMDELNMFLSPNDASFYLEKTIPNDVNPHELISYLYKHHSISQHDSGLGWNICYITENDFTLDGCRENTSFSPLHNYPIGDTVYILYSEPPNVYGESTLYRERACEIKEKIKEWRSNYFPFYSKKSKRNIYAGFSPRVRVIIFPLDNSPRTKEIERESAEADQNVEKKFSSFDTIYSSISEIFSQNNRNLKYDQKLRLVKLGWESLLELLLALSRAISLANEVERVNRIDEIIKDYLQSNTKTLQRTLSKGDDNFE